MCEHTNIMWRYKFFFFFCSYRWSSNRTTVKHPLITFRAGGITTLFKTSLSIFPNELQLRLLHSVRRASFCLILLEEKHHEVSVLSASQRGFGSFFHWRTEKNPQQKLLKMVNLMAKRSMKSSVFHVAGSGAIMNRFQTQSVTFTPRFLSSCELGGCRSPQSAVVQSGEF